MALALLFAFAGAVGCADGRVWWNDPKKREWSLIELQKAYTDYVRFGAFDKASRFVDPEMAEAYVQSFPNPEVIRFTDYEVTPVVFEDDEQREVATSTVTYKAYRTDTLVITTIVEKQEWYRVDQFNTWRVRPSFQGLGNLASNGRAR
ncbi:MAG: hypothetical protein JRG96_09570 [Deltaproteobacteria bacterium]|nr:hypothetical protein [Deltaproteobacteria bacterium]MBW2420870.1 hypothetical protein [Deltaproteobacteria bacterium]